jgi:hypothetical protein
MEDWRTGRLGSASAKPEPVEKQLLIGDLFQRAGWRQSENRGLLSVNGQDEPWFGVARAVN